jgi:hypothetical protein
LRNLKKSFSVEKRVVRHRVLQATAGQKGMKDYRQRSCHLHCHRSIAKQSYSKQSKPKQSKAMPSKAMLSKAKQSKAKPSKARHSKEKQSKAKQS